MRARAIPVMAAPFLLWAALGWASDPAPGAVSEAGEEILVTLEVPLFSPLFASTPLASVEDEVITFKDLVRTIASSHAGRAGSTTSLKRDYANLLGRLLTTKLIVQEARNIGLDELPDVAAQIDDFALRVLMQRLMSRELASVEPDPIEVDRLYDRMSREFLLTTLQFENEEDALAFREQYDASGDFTQVAMRFFEEGKATGELGADQYVKLRDLLPNVAQAADRLEVGSASQIFTSSEGFLVFHVRDIRSYDDPGLRKEARQKVIEPLRRERAREYAESLEQKHATIDYDLLARVPFAARKTGLPLFRREVPVDYEELLADERVLATVHGEEPFTVTVADLAAKLKRGFFHSVGESLKGRKDLEVRKVTTLKNMVFEKTVPLEARRLGLDREEGYLDAVDQNTTSVLFGVFVRKVIAPDVKITEEEARRYYAEHIEDFSTPRMLRLRGLAFDTLRHAEGALDKLKRGADFQWVSANTEGQVDTEAERIIDFDDVLLSVNSLPEVIQPGARGARRGDSLLYSGPDDNHYVIFVAKVFPPNPQPYEAVLEQISESISAEKVKELVADWGVKLREAYEPRIFLQGLENTGANGTP